MLVLSDPSGFTLWNVYPNLEYVRRIEFESLKGWRTSVAFSSSAKSLVAVADNSSTFRLFDLGDDSSYRLKHGAAWIQAVAFSPDGRLLASASHDSTIKLWNVATREPLATLRGYGAPLVSLQFSPDGKTLASMGEDTVIRLWDVSQKRLRSTLRGHTLGKSFGFGVDLQLLAFAPQEGLLVSAASDGTLKWWDEKAMSEQNAVILRGFDSWIHSLAFSPDDRLLAAVANDPGTVKLWDVASRRELPEKTIHGLRGYALFVAFSPDGKLVAVNNNSTDDKTVAVWNVDPWHKKFEKLDAGKATIRQLMFLPDGRSLAASCWGGATTVWDLTSDDPDEHPQRLRFGEGGGNCLAYSPDGTLLAAGSEGGKLDVWSRLRSHRWSGSMQTTDKAVWDIAFSPDRRTLASLIHGRTVDLWEVETRKTNLLVQRKGSLTGHVSQIWTMAFAPDGTLATAGDDGMVRIWNVELQANVATLRGHLGPVGAVAFSPDGALLASAAADGTIRLWQAATNEEVRSAGR